MLVGKSRVTGLRPHKWGDHITHPALALGDDAHAAQAMGMTDGSDIAVAPLRCSEDLAVAIEKLLSGSEGSLMKLFKALHETKALAELVMQRLSVVAHDIQSTTS
jgi:hypothetical protein